MENKRISNYADLKLAINELTYNRKAKEEKIKNSIDDIKARYRKIILFKENIANMVSDYSLYRHPLRTIFKRGLEFVKGKAKNGEPKRRSFVTSLLENILSSINK
jgi:hypothetical protein